MAGSSWIVGAFFKLDNLLFESGARECVLFVAGGAAINLKYNSARYTRDVDSMSVLDDTVKKLVQKVGHELKISDDWLNDEVLNGTFEDPSILFNLSELLPDGWDQRAAEDSPVFSGEVLTVFSLSKTDLVKAKLLALYIRMAHGSDAEDLQKIGISREEVEGNLDWLFGVLKYAGAPSPKSEIRWRLHLLLFGEDTNPDGDIFQ